MAALGRFILGAANAAMSALQINNEPPPFDSPTVQDVLAVKRMFLQAIKLPLEIVDTVIDYAEYWPHTSVVTNHSFLATGAHIGREQESGNVFVIRSLPLGYVHDDSDEFAIPVSSGYNEPHLHVIPSEIDYGEVARTTTSAILNRWSSRSIPRSQHPCRKIVFTIKSRDQGWGGDKNDHGTYRGSFTWFDVGLERLEAIDTSQHTPPPHFSRQIDLGAQDDETRAGALVSCDIRTVFPQVAPVPGNESKYRIEHPFLPPPTRVQSNVMASKVASEHVITWAHDDAVDPESPEGDELEAQGRGRASVTGGYVRHLELGDIVTVWARARFPGWRNHVEKVKVDVYWAV